MNIWCKFEDLWTSITEVIIGEANLPPPILRDPKTPPKIGLRKCIFIAKISTISMKLNQYDAIGELYSSIILHASCMKALNSALSFNVST